MKKIIPIILMVVSVFGTLFSAFTFVLALVFKNTNGIEGFPILMLVVVFLVISTVLTFATMSLSRLFKLDKLCRVSMVISFLGFAFAILSWILLYI